MATVPSASNQDPTLYCQYFGGPNDGFKTGDLPAEPSGMHLTGTTITSPMAEPHHHSLRAVYECVGETQVNGYWQFFYRGLQGPNGERLVAADDESESHPLASAE